MPEPLRTRIKFCGITRVEDALAAVALGVDALGFVFYRNSPRYVTARTAAEIASVMPAFVSKVALFVNPQPGEVDRVLNGMHVDLLQFHGEESPQECRTYGRPFIKAVRMRADTDLARISSRYAAARAILADAYDPRHHGGTGATFDWRSIGAFEGKALILAGGLTPDNVGAAVRSVRPYAVDVSSGIESAPGKKDPAKMRRFVESVNDASA